MSMTTRGRRSPRPSSRHAIAVAGLAAALALAACGSATPAGKARHRSGSKLSTTTTSQAVQSPAAQGGAQGAGHGSTGAAGGTAGATGAGAGSGAGGTMAAGPTPAQPGTYRYTQSGSFKAGISSQSVPAQGTVVVDPPTAESPGSWTQVWHSYLDTSQPPTDTTFDIAPGGISVASEVIRMSGVTISCTFSPPVEVISWPPAVGHQFSGTGQCGSFTAQVSGSVTGTQPTSVDGAAVTAYVVQTHVTTSGSVNSSSTETDWFDPALGLDLYQDSSESGTYQGTIAFSSHVTRTIVSGRPG